MDVHNQKPINERKIDKVGIKNLRYPIKVFDKKEAEQHTVANINMYVSLPKEFRGTHMSRFVEVLNKHKNTIALKNMKIILKDIIDKFRAESAHMELEFPYFIEKEAPKSGARSLMEYNCKFICSLQNGKFYFILGVKVPVSTICPCSGHSQRANIDVLIKFKGFFWIEDLVKIIEDCASTSLFALLKREDEDFIIENAIPMFVEDVVRKVSFRLEEQKDITWYSVNVESHESIHNHNAYAFIEKHG